MSDSREDANSALTAEAYRLGMLYKTTPAEGGVTKWVWSAKQCHGAQEAAAYVLELKAAQAMKAGREAEIGDTVTVGGIPFTKVSNSPFPEGTMTDEEIRWLRGGSDGN